jgi:hypothetical protein
MRALLVRFAQWRLDSPKRIHRSSRRDAFILLVATVLFVFFVRLMIAPRSKFFRGPTNALEMSVLHPRTPYQAPLNPGIFFRIKSSNGPLDEYEEAFPLHGKREPGVHYRLASAQPARTHYCGEENQQQPL